MTQTFAVNSNNDLYIGRDGNLAIVNSLDAILQNCEHAAKTTLGELVLQTNVGIPDFQVVWNGVPNIQQFNASLRQALLAVDGVVEILSLNTVRNGDALIYQAVIRTIYSNAETSLIIGQLSVKKRAR